MVPEGTWKARGVEGALGFTSEDREQVAVDMLITDEECESLGQHMTWYGYFTDKTTETTLKSLRTLGWASDDLSDLSGIDANEVFIVVVHEEDQEGNLRARIRWVNATAGGLAMKKRMDDDAAKAFAARMKGHVLNMNRKGGGAAPANAQTQPAAATSTQAKAKAQPKRPPAGGGSAPAVVIPPEGDEIPF